MKYKVKGTGAEVDLFWEVNSAGIEWGDKGHVPKVVCVQVMHRDAAGGGITYRELYTDPPVVRGMVEEPTGSRVDWHHLSAAAFALRFKPTKVQALKLFSKLLVRVDAQVMTLLIWSRKQQGKAGGNMKPRAPKKGA